MRSSEVKGYCKHNGITKKRKEFISKLKANPSRLEEEADEVIGWNSY